MGKYPDSKVWVCALFSCLTFAAEVPGREGFRQGGDGGEGKLKEKKSTRKNRESHRQTKPKKGQFMNLSRGHSGQKFDVNRACFPKDKHQKSHRNGEIHELFVLTLSLIWFAGATPEQNAQYPCPKDPSVLKKNGA